MRMENNYRVSNDNFESSLVESLKHELIQNNFADVTLISEDEKRTKVKYFERKVWKIFYFSSFSGKQINAGII